MTTAPMPCPNCARPSRRQFRYPEGVIHSCTACDLQWAVFEGTPGEGEVNVTLVHDTYMDSDSLGDPSTYPPFVDFFERLDGLMPNSRLKLLDVGCGNGVFVGECLRRGIDVTGVEIDHKHARQMPAHIREHVIFKPIEELVASTHDFNVITFWDSFEHLPRAFQILDALAGSLVANGIIFLRVNNTHDIFNIAAKLFTVLAPPVGHRLVKICFNLPQHAWNFSNTALRSMLARRGWTVRDWRFTETPAARLTNSFAVRAMIETAYLVNRAIGGGKIGEYWIAKNA